MAFSRTTPPSIRIHRANSYHRQRSHPDSDEHSEHDYRHSYRTASQSSSSTTDSDMPPSYLSRNPIAIPHAGQEHIAPPALPPPRNLDIDASNDPGWKWGNTLNGGNGFGLAPIKPGSSLRGWDMRTEQHDERGEQQQHHHHYHHEQQQQQYQQQQQQPPPPQHLSSLPGLDRRESDMSTVRAPSDPEIKPAGNDAVVQGSGSLTVANYTLVLVHFIYIFLLFPMA